jgi:hypothetical protein
MRSMIVPLGRPETDRAKRPSSRRGIPWGYLDPGEAPAGVSYHVVFIGEPVGIRTRDLLIKSQLLYRLSYGLFQMVMV